MTALALIAALTAGLSVWIGLRPAARWRGRSARGHGVQPDAGSANGRWAGVSGPDAAGVTGPAEGSAPIEETDVPLLLELSAGLLQAGQPVSGVLTTLARIVPGCEPLGRVAHAVLASVEWERAWVEAPPAFRPLADALGFAHRSGSAAARLLRTTAAEQRRAAVRAEERRAAELGVRLVVPLGLCALPAFICIGILPLVISMLPEF